MSVYRHRVGADNFSYKNFLEIHIVWYLG